MNPARKLADAQRAEAEALYRLHFEQRQVTVARTALSVAMLQEAIAREAHEAAVAARTALERPEVMS